MKEIKFRIWDREDTIMRYFTLDEMLERRLGYYGSFDLKVLREEKMQYTGLKYKNGEEIYEGDIIKTSYGVGAVKHGKYEYSACEEYECVRYGWHVDINYTCYVKNTGYDLEGHEYVEVIGNIYENPELLQ